MATIPVIIAVADVKNKDPRDAKEPAQLMHAAILSALKDSQLASPAIEKLKTDIDSIDVVRTWTWPYRDLPGLLAQKLGVAPKHAHYTEHGGNQPAMILDDAAFRIASGKAKVAVITGGEALASLGMCAKTGKMPPPGWTKSENPVTEVFSPSNLDLEEDVGGQHGIGTPIQIYPLYENAFRAHRKQSIEQNNEESAQLYEQFSEISSQNPYSWSYGNPPESAKAIGTVSSRNRMICFPYPLLMNAFNTVNLAAACILTSLDYARDIGIPESQWIYPLGGAGAREADRFWERTTYVQSPAICKALDQCLLSSGLQKEDIDLYDFYSCFPIVPKLACHHLGLPITNPASPVTLLGGLTSFGGAGNNYSMHAITEMVRQLRRGRGRNGLVLANGGFLTYQHAICLSSKPRRDSSWYPNGQVQSLIDDLSAPETDTIAEGEGIVETYTVEFERDGRPLRAYIVGRLRSNGHRFLANEGNQQTLSWLASSSEEPIGKIGHVKPHSDDKGTHLGNLFNLGPKSSL